MKKLLFILSFLPSVLLAQNFADKNYYLVDSLDLDALTKSDSILIDTCLRNYQAAKDDTSRIIAISMIVEESWDDNVWPKYNAWLYEYVRDKLLTLPKDSPPSILKALKTSLSGTLNNIGYIHDDQGKIELALVYYQKSLKIQEEISDKRGMATTLSNIGLIHHNQGKIALALKYYQKSLKIQEEIGDKKGMALSNNNIGGIHDYQGEISLALDCHHKSLKLYEEIGDKSGMAYSYNNIGSIHDEQGEIELALEYYQKSLKMQEELGDKRGMAYSYNNIGVNHSRQGKIELTLEYYQKSLKLREEIGDKKGMALSNNNIGKVHKDQGEIKLALVYFHKSLKLSEEINDKRGMATSNYNIGSIALEQEVLDGAEGALALATKSLSIAQEIGYPDRIRDATELLSQIYEKKGMGIKALEMHKLYIQMRDSVFSEETQKAAIQTQAKYKYEKKKALDEKEHEKLLAIEKEEKEKQQILTYSATSGGVLVLVFLVFVFNRLKVTRRQKTIIEETNEELNQTNEELATQRDQIEHQRRDLQDKNEEITASINYAKLIQEALLRNEEHANSRISSHFILFMPKDIVSGDFYWFLQKQEHLYLAAADCTGHGVPGAFLTMLGTSFLNEINSTPKLLKPAEILNALRERIVKELSQTGAEGESKDGMDISILRLNLTTNEVQWAGANNPIYILRNGTQDIEVTKGDREPIGYAKNMTPFTNHEFKLEKGDTIYLFSDGYADQFGGPKGKKFSYKQLRNLFVEISSKPMEEQKKVLETTFDNWIAQGEEEQIDDVCVIGVRI